MKASSVPHIKTSVRVSGANECPSCHTGTENANEDAATNEKNLCSISARRFRRTIPRIVMNRNSRKKKYARTVASDSPIRPSSASAYVPVPMFGIAYTQETSSVHSPCCIEWGGRTPAATAASCHIAGCISGCDHAVSPAKTRPASKTASNISHFK